MNLRRWTLAFTGDDRHLEADYLARTAALNLGHLRFCHVVSILFISAWAFIDLAFYPDRARTFLLIKFAGIVPMFVAGLLFSYTGTYRRIYSIVSSVYVVVIGTGFTAMAAMALGNDVTPLFMGIALTYVFNYTFIRSRFIHSVVAGWLVLVIYACSMLWKTGGSPGPGVAGTIFFGVVLNLLGTIVSYTQERWGREAFVLNRRLEESLLEIRLLEGILPVCASCKMIRNEEGHWTQIETYISERTNADFTHTMCPACAKALYPDL